MNIVLSTISIRQRFVGAHHTLKLSRTRPTFGSPLKSRNVVKSDGLVIHGKTDGELTANRVGINLRDEYSLTPRLFVFGQNQY